MTARLTSGTSAPVRCELPEVQKHSGGMAIDGVIQAVGAVLGRAKVGISW
jgi:hypothetical protein